MTPTDDGPYAVRVRLFDLSGRLVRTLANDVTVSGTNAIGFDGRSDAGQRLAPGLYAALIEVIRAQPVSLTQQTIGVVIAGAARSHRH